MRISARVQNSQGQHQVSLATNDTVHSLSIPPKPTGFGSSANGGELLFLALATCYCNDIYREADIRTLMQHTDQVAEIQNSLRVVTPVRLSQIDVQTV